MLTRLKLAFIDEGKTAYLITMENERLEEENPSIEDPTMLSQANIWKSPNTIRRSASHGCIRLTNWDAARVVNQATEGVTVQIY